MIYIALSSFFFFFPSKLIIYFISPSGYRELMEDVKYTIFSLLRSKTHQTQIKNQYGFFPYLFIITHLIYRQQKLEPLKAKLFLDTKYKIS